MMEVMNVWLHQSFHGLSDDILQNHLQEIWIEHMAWINFMEVF